ncbi:hypothetical protein [Dokdonella soli]|uniref:hypothetical protein n=1 Tax=Dokdonella soli TaxID=529810 RepID=UPI0031D85E36
MRGNTVFPRRDFDAISAESWCHIGGQAEAKSALRRKPRAKPDDQLPAAANYIAYPRVDAPFAPERRTTADDCYVRLRLLLAAVVDVVALEGDLSALGRAKCLLNGGDTIGCLTRGVASLFFHSCETGFGPFWRKDSAHAARDHAGLGIALASGYAVAMRAELAARLDGDHVLRFSLRLPRS